MINRVFLTALLALMAGTAVAADSAAVFIPGFWDSQAPLRKPDLEAGTPLRFVTSTDYPPFGFTGPDGTLAGFEVDLAHAVCDELKVPCTIQARPWNDLFPALAGQEADAAIASLSITPASRRLADFTRPYYKTPARFLVRAEAPPLNPTPASLAGQRITVAAGTAHEAYLRAFFPQSIIVTLPSPEAARAALKSGQADLVFDDGVGAALWLGGPGAAGCCAFRGGPFTESRFFGEGAGIAVRKGDAPLRRALDDALARLARDGRYADLYLKYFPIGFY
ncbi:transporter substrate-binding domain-containing protein [Lichenihabitans sp. Uapishka_5]|uniref:transporter substrate-binding domain-containing protein n=1 Tax=Lichenihabitans sp. Uapishka_5 TaxID=3037302 RepID=UPI0029E818A7|nr:transporter substrate-binding domain-containing protein [Lichenihabitans sp. Uapishka_5]MDX7953508.1 transporter substrate-binding domain-containing protein [Lichenihabitans sp. Uapishka_5]